MALSCLQTIEFFHNSHISEGCVLLSKKYGIHSNVKELRKVQKIVSVLSRFGPPDSQGNQLTGQEIQHLIIEKVFSSLAIVCQYF